MPVGGIHIVEDLDWEIKNLKSDRLSPPFEWGLKEGRMSQIRGGTLEVKASVQESCLAARYRRQQRAFKAKGVLCRILSTVDGGGSF